MNCFLFDGLNEEEQQQIEKILGTPETFIKGDDLYKTGRLAVLCRGKAAVLRRGGTGEEVTVRTISAGEVFGAASVFGSWEEGFSSVVAEENGSVIYISEEILRKIFTEFPKTALNYIAFLSDRIRFLNRRIDAFTAGSTEHKIYEYLVSAADGDGIVKFDFKMAELARRLKIGRTSLYRGLSALCENGLITRNNNQITVNLRRN